jgi:hypothetical protein
MASPPGPSDDESVPLGTRGVLTIIMLVVLLAGAIGYAVHSWSTMGASHISTLGWIFLGCGIFFSCVVGGSLMALLFYSHRNHFDR